VTKATTPLLPWLLAPDGAYVIGAKEFAERPEWSNAYACPRCGREIHPILRRVVDESADVLLGLEGACPMCGADLVVVPDKN
jgi:predicted RNA-binding Zn-ribbon protein involved in translation (DUF1610 family)